MSQTPLRERMEERLRAVGPLVADVDPAEDGVVHDADDIVGMPLSAAVEHRLTREHYFERCKRTAAEMTEDEEDVGRPPKRWKYLHDCFLCAYGNRGVDATADAGSKAFVELGNLIKSLYGTMSNYDLGVSCANFYYAHLQQPSDARRARGLDRDTPPLPDMPPEKFVAHIELHTLSPVLMVGEATRYVQQTLILNRTTHTSDSRAVDKMAKIVASLKTMLTIPRDLYFGQRDTDAVALDPTALAAPINERTLRGLLATGTRARIGGATATDTTREATDQRPVFLDDDADASQDMDALVGLI
jgi:hypothetical protein